jgi:hypothetical protein
MPLGSLGKRPTPGVLRINDTKNGLSPTTPVHLQHVHMIFDTIAELRRASPLHRIRQHELHDSSEIIKIPGIKIQLHNADRASHDVGVVSPRHEPPAVRGRVHGRHRVDGHVHLEREALSGAVLGEHKDVRGDSDDGGGCGRHVLEDGPVRAVGGADIRDRPREVRCHPTTVAPRGSRIELGEHSRERWVVEVLGSGGILGGGGHGGGRTTRGVVGDDELLALVVGHCTQELQVVVWSDVVDEAGVGRPLRVHVPRAIRVWRRGVVCGVVAHDLQVGVVGGATVAHESMFIHSDAVNTSTSKPTMPTYKAS